MALSVLLKTIMPASHKLGSILRPNIRGVLMASYQLASLRSVLKPDFEPKKHKFSHGTFSVAQNHSASLTQAWIYIEAQY